MGNGLSQVVLQWRERLKDRSCFLMWYSHSSLACEESKNQIKLAYECWPSGGIKRTVVFLICQVLWERLTTACATKKSCNISELHLLHTLMWSGASVRRKEQTALCHYIISPFSGKLHNILHVNTYCEWQLFYLQLFTMCCETTNQSPILPHGAQTTVWILSSWET